MYLMDGSIFCIPLIEELAEVEIAHALDDVIVHAKVLLELLLKGLPRRNELLKQRTITCKK